MQGHSLCVEILVPARICRGTDLIAAVETKYFTAVSRSGSSLRVAVKFLNRGGGDFCYIFSLFI